MPNTYNLLDIRGALSKTHKNLVQQNKSMLSKYKKEQFRLEERINRHSPVPYDHSSLFMGRTQLNQDSFEWLKSNYKTPLARASSMLQRWK